MDSDVIAPDTTEQTPRELAPYILLPGEGVAGFDASIKASRTSTGGNLSLIESHTRGGAPWHVHTREDEYFYILEGAIEVHCQNQSWEAAPRSFVFLPRGIPHCWDVVGTEATLLMMTVPAMLEEFLRAFHAAPTKAERDQVASQYGITFLPPPAK
jgi:quercetin dioxygenase-like cupin family protein